MRVAGDCLQCAAGLGSCFLRPHSFCGWLVAWGETDGKGEENNDKKSDREGEREREREREKQKRREREREKQKRRERERKERERERERHSLQGSSLLRGVGASL